MRCPFILGAGLLACSAARPTPAAPPAEASAPAAPAGALAWDLPVDCPLRYRVLTSAGWNTGRFDEDLPSPEPHHVTERDVVVRRTNDHVVRIDVENTFIAPLHDGVPGEWTMAAWSHFPLDVLHHPDHFEAEDWMWGESPEDGRTPELGLLWPALPSTAEVGASCTWTIPQAEGKPRYGAMVTVSERTEERTVLTAHWRGELNDDARGTCQRIPPTERIRVGRVEGSGRWEISDEGRLLSATVDRDVDVLETIEGKPSRRERAHIRTEASLVSSCDD